MLPDFEIVKTAWACKCPKCKQGNLYKPGLTLTLNQQCPSCGLDLSKSDSADGPAVFLIFILGFLLVPLALAIAFQIDMPLWLHALIWGVVILGLTIGSLRPIKAYIIALQYKHRPNDWK